MTQQPAHILVFDPGGTTGAALFFDTLLTGVGAIHHLPSLEKLICHLPYDHGVVVCESFSAIRLSRDGQATIEIIGVIKYLTRKYLHSDPVMLRPQEKQAFAQAARTLLKQQKPKGVTYKEHHYDAVALGLRYLWTTHPEAQATAYAVSDLLAIEEFSPVAEIGATKPLTAITK